MQEVVLLEKGMQRIHYLKMFKRYLPKVMKIVTCIINEKYYLDLVELSLSSFVYFSINKINNILSSCSQGRV